METHHLALLYLYVRHCIETKDPKPLRFHNRYAPYNRKQSTFDVLRKGMERKIIFPPRIFCNYKLGARLVEHRDTLLVNQFEETTRLENTQYAVLLLGSHSLFCVKSVDSESNLRYANCIFPMYPSQKRIGEIDPCSYEPGKLPEMKIPPIWSSLDWEVFRRRRNPLASSVKIGEALGVSYKTVLESYNKIIHDCIMWMPFFPLGYENYTQYFISFKTDYETGFLEELKKIDRSSYIYKVNDVLLMNLFFEKHLEINSILGLEKKGVIYNLCVSSPIWHYTKHWP